MAVVGAGPRVVSRIQPGRNSLASALLGLLETVYYSGCFAGRVPMNRPLNRLLGPIVVFIVTSVTAGVAEAEAIPDPPWLRNELIAVRNKYELPAMAAAVVTHGRIVAASAIGYRKLGNLTLVTRDDPFHLGSITKPMTATLVGLCVDQRILGWDTTIAEMFPELVQTMQPAYRSVTVAQLLSHTSGLPYQPHTPEGVTDSRADDSPGRRYEYVKAAVQDEPKVAPGTKTIYSGGAVIVASYLERKLGIPYERLMRERLFARLQMRRAGFGSMATEGRVDGPWEHVWQKGKFAPVAPSFAQREQARAPVGRNVYCSVIDLAQFAALHLNGAHGRSQFLSAATFQRLHTPMPGGYFAPGFAVAPDTWMGKQTLWHSGSTGRNYATCSIGVQQDFAVCVMTNAGGGPASKACDDVQFFVGDYLKALEKLSANTPPTVNPTNRNTVDRLTQVKGLYDQGLISKEVYEQNRKEIIDSL
jgi:D-alanyl-D-alanine carboxypeptidase